MKRITSLLLSTIAFTSPLMGMEKQPNDNQNPNFLQQINTQDNSSANNSSDTFPLLQVPSELIGKEIAPYLPIKDFKNLSYVNKYLHDALFNNINSLKTYRITNDILNDAIRPLYDRLSGLNGLSVGDVRLTPEELNNITNLTNLTDLHLNLPSKQANVEFLSQLTKLKKLGVYAPLPIGHSLEGVEAFSNLTNLTNLSIHPVQQLGDLSDLTNLTNLNLRFSDNLKDIKTLSSLFNLTHLDLSCCSTLTDIQPVSTLTNLTNLNLAGCFTLADIEAVSNLKNLEEFNVYGHNIQSLNPLFSLINLKDVRLSGVAKNLDLSPLAHLSNIEKLDFLYGDEMQNISFLTFLNKIKDLRIDGCQVKNIDALSSLTNLEKLYLFGDQIVDLSPVSRLTNLEKLTVQGQNITSVDPLSGLNNLENLVLLQCSKVSNLKPLYSLDNLHYFTCYHEGHPLITDEERIALWEAFQKKNRKYSLSVSL